MPEERLLSRNAIKKFILRVDLIKTDKINIAKIAEEMSKLFDRTEKRQISNFAINFTKSNSEVTQKQSFDFVLISESKSLTMTFSEIQNAFWLESNQYKSNILYKDTIKKTIENLRANCGEVESKRIGLRYINEFKCEKQKLISSIFGKRLSSILKAMINSKLQSRIIGMEEYNKDSYKKRLQYGISNKFYPSVITIYDLILDIDSFIENTNSITEWEEIIANLNHTAYETFKDEMNLKYIEELK